MYVERSVAKSYRFGSRERPKGFQWRLRGKERPRQRTTWLTISRALGGLLYGAAAVDGPTFAAMAALMLGSGGLAAYVPARRASRVDPCESLRSD
jgi:hypothetical protein